MKRSSTGNETKRSSGTSGLSSSQRLAAAGSQAIEAHARVRWLAIRLGEELDGATPYDVPRNVGPEDSMATAVEKAASTMKAVTASMAAVVTPPVATPIASTPSTKLGMGTPASKPPVATKLGIGTGSRHKSETDGQ